MAKPLIAITMGDPAGVGPELCLQALQHPETLQQGTPIVIGDAFILKRCAQQLHGDFDLPILEQQHWYEQYQQIVKPCILHVPSLNYEAFQPTEVSADTGRAAYAYIQQSLNMALEAQVQAVVTAPINKAGLHAAGIHFPGHTEIYTEATGASRSCMFQFSREVAASFVTVHVGYHEVPALLSTQRILDVIELTAVALEKIHGRAPRLAVLGLNPHAGENGLFGNREEERIIQPAILKAQALGHNIEGPLPPDTAFIPAKRAVIDGFICMYHDQGHIPLKALAFDSAVNTTLGLPIIRTSVDHGTACDIAWQGIANPGSLFCAYALAAQLSQDSSI